MTTLEQCKEMASIALGNAQHLLKSEGFLNPTSFFVTQGKVTHVLHLPTDGIKQMEMAYFHMAKLAKRILPDVVFSIHTAYVKMAKTEDIEAERAAFEGDPRAIETDPDTIETIVVIIKGRSVGFWNQMLPYYRDESGNIVFHKCMPLMPAETGSFPIQPIGDWWEESKELPHCDFCYCKEPLVDTFEANVNIFGLPLNITVWHACAECARLVKDRRLDDLVTRAMILIKPRHEVISSQDLAALLSKCYTAVFASLDEQQAARRRACN